MPEGYVGSISKTGPIVQRHVDTDFIVPPEKCFLPEFPKRYPQLRIRQNDGTRLDGGLLSILCFLIIDIRKRRTEKSMPLNTEETIQLLLRTNKEQEETIADLRAAVKDLRAAIANLNETLEDLKRKLFGVSSEKISGSGSLREESREEEESLEETTAVKGHTRARKKKSIREDLYQALPVKEVLCDVPKEERFCLDCDAVMEHLGYKFVREELRITPAKVVRVRYMQETLVCPVCRVEDETTIRVSRTPTALLAYSPASLDMVAMVMYQKSFLHLPFYRQSKDWLQKGVPLARETAAHWYNHCAREYLYPVYEVLHQELPGREVIHADEVPCQVLHEEGKDAASKSYMWIYLSGTDGRPPVVLYDYRPGRKGDYPIEFLSGFTGMIHCDGYSA